MVFSLRVVERLGRVPEDAKLVLMLSKASGREGSRCGILDDLEPKRVLVLDLKGLAMDLRV